MAGRLADVMPVRTGPVIQYKHFDEVIMTHRLCVDSVQISFDGRTILSDVFLQCRTGDVIGLFGRNGSGKSTLLKILFGVLRPDYRYIKIDEEVILRNDRLQQLISYLPQDPFIPDFLPVRKAVALSIDSGKTQGFLSDPQIAEMADLKVSQLSGGQRRYLEVKTVLESNSLFALLDEPFNGLSPLMTETVSGLISAAAVQKGIIISDHDYSNVLKISTSLVLLKNGGIHRLQSGQELIDEGYLSAGMD